MIKSRVRLLTIVLGLGLAVAGCSATPPAPLKSGEAMQKLADAGYPCDYPDMTNFVSPLRSYLGFHCVETAGSKVGYTVAFFADDAELESSKKHACLPSQGPGVDPKDAEEEFLLGSNWVATSDPGSKIDLALLEKVLPQAKRTSLAEICKQNG